MIALLSEPLAAWYNGENVVLYGIRSGDGPEDALVVTAEGKIEFRPLADLQTEWFYDPKRRKWSDVTPAASEDDDE